MLNECIKECGPMGGGCRHSIGGTGPCGAVSGPNSWNLMVIGEGEVVGWLGARVTK